MPPRVDPILPPVGLVTSAPIYNALLMERVHLFRMTSWRAVLPALALSMFASLWCRWELGAGLGFFLCTASLAALYVPALVSIESGWGRITSTGAAIFGVAVVWGIAAASMDVT